MTGNVLVTGGAGYIGSHVCKTLSELGYTPITYDNLSRGFKSSIKWGPFVQGDLRQRDILANALLRFKPMAVMHFAALAYVGESTTDPLSYYDNNVGGTISLLAEMKNSGVSNIIFSSTCSTYQQTNKLISELTPQNPMNPYGRSKLMAENILQDFSSANQFRHMILRYFNAAGADIEGKIGENHNPETHLIPLAIRASIDTSSQLELYGLDYPTEDGSAIRDYIHVSDLATAHVKALEYMLQGGACKTFNLGTGAGYSVLQIMKTIELITNKPVDYVIKDRREGDPAKLVADPSLAMRELNWRPDNSEISNIVHSAFLWQKKLLDYA